MAGTFAFSVISLLKNVTENVAEKIRNYVWVNRLPHKHSQNKVKHKKFFPHNFQSSGQLLSIYGKSVFKTTSTRLNSELNSE